MGQHNEVVRASFRAYMVKVVLWLLVSIPGGMLLMAFVSRALGDAPTLVGILGFATMLGVVGGALRIHSTNVRCPACNAWLVPVGVAGLTPKQCPKCAADLS
jgi:hypothetical protein